jgi:hypothetical protein
MALYTFHMCNGDGFSGTFEVRDLPYDSATYPVASKLLEENPSASYVAVWAGERPVLARHRDGPVIRPVPEDLPGRRA